MDIAMTKIFLYFNNGKHDYNNNNDNTRVNNSQNLQS